MTFETFPYSIPQTGTPIWDQDNLIEDLTIALGLIENPNRDLREKGAKIMIELMNSPIEEPANRTTAMEKAKENILKHSND